MLVCLFDDFFFKTAERKHKMRSPDRVKTQILFIFHDAFAPAHRQILFRIIILMLSYDIIGDILRTVGNLCRNAFLFISLRG